MPPTTVALLAPELALTDAAKLAQGILDDVPPRLDMDRAGPLASPVLTPALARAFSSELPTPLKRIADEARASSERLGVRWVERNALHRALTAQVAAPEPVETIHLPSVSGRLLVTEEMMNNLAEGTREIVVPPSAILTPLARDVARRRGIRIRYRDR
ncbi:MAG: hypothetical protein KatS3mg115_0948 [Candidatus Poribacteria bacterium]|nr:MAG: hypothetical protein KatS3mg115_0948 [Candidatus Poribacteria bacterium]